MNTLFVLLGPTGVGKTALSLRLAEHFNCPIISADSRQIYKEIPVGTASPSADDLARVKHYGIATHTLGENYSAGQFEVDTLRLLAGLQGCPQALVTGGSMLYLKAVCRGIDDIPDISPEVRSALYAQYKREGLDGILAELHTLDPQHYDEVDRNNYKRVIHAVEVCRTSGRTYSSFRSRQSKERPFRAVKVGLIRSSEELYARIDRRTDEMMAAGLLDEVRRVAAYRQCNSLNTVGYKELLRHLDGEWTLEHAVEKIKQNTRIYARKQAAWFKKDSSITWFHPDREEDILAFLTSEITPSEDAKR